MLSCRCRQPRRLGRRGAGGGIGEVVESCDDDVPSDADGVLVGSMAVSNCHVGMNEIAVVPKNMGAVGHVP